ncbi:DNA repair protein RadC [Stutzerimonas stutzeri ATCC 14405 = CCUG 16156]|nr:DNA repair protein RadC [Stutzerimonas stutzeri ATCC 14405 = CCUG 16156]
MKFHKLKAGEVAGSYLVDSPVSETDILRMAQQLATQRLSKGRALTDPHKVREHLQVLLQDLPHAE